MNSKKCNSSRAGEKASQNKNKNNNVNKNNKQKVPNTGAKPVFGMSNLFASTIILPEYIDAKLLRETFSIPVAHISEVSDVNRPLIDKKAFLHRSARFVNEFDVVTTYCDYRNANEGMHVTRNLHGDCTLDQLARYRGKHYVINDPDKTVLTPGSNIVVMPLSKNSEMRCTMVNKVGLPKDHIIITTPDGFVMDPDSFVDFGGEIQHLSPAQLYNIAKNAQVGEIGYGYILSSLGDVSHTQPVSIGTKNIGLIRRVKVGREEPLSIKIGPDMVTYRYTYLPENTATQMIPNPDPITHTFLLELHQVDMFSLGTCSVKRFKLVKTSLNSKSYDANLGDEVFIEGDDADTANVQILSGGLESVEVVSTRNLLHKITTQAAPRSLNTSEMEVKEEPQYITLRRKRDGRIFDYIQDIVATTKNLALDNVYKKVPRKVVNKVTLNFINSAAMTAQLVKTNLGFIVSNCPELDLVNEAVPVMMYAIKETACVEAMLSASLQSNDAELIGALKANNFKITPNGLKDAWNKGVLFDYLGAKIRSLFGLTEVGSVNPSNSKLDFH